MNRSKTVAVLVAVVSCALSGVASAQAPTCSTLDLGGRAATGFRAGDEFVLKGAGFPADVLVLVTFRQPPQVVELARFKTDGLGEFASQPTILRIPSDAASGPATIRVASSGGSATCNVAVASSSSVARPAVVTSSGPTEDTGNDLSPWFAVWALLLALGAAFLGYIRYRRWSQDRLEQEISALGGGSRVLQHIATERRPERKRRRLGDVVESPPPPLPPNE